MKKLVSLFLCLALILSIVPASVVAESPEDQFTYDIKNGKATLTGVLEDSEVLYLPETLGGCTVTRIAGGAVKNLTAKKIIIPETVEILECAAIYKCASATVYITGKDTAFEGDSIQGVRAVCGYPSDAYYDMGIGQHYLPIEEMPPEPWTLEEVTEGSITYAVFDGQAIVLTAKGETVNVPETLGGCPVTYIAPCAFVAEEIKYLSLCDSIRVIGRKALDSPYLRSSVALPTALEYVGECAFYQVKTTGDLPSIKHIGKNAFYSNRRTEIVFGESLEYIADLAFSNNSFSKVTIPSGTKYLGELSFGTMSGTEIVELEMTVLSKDVVCNGAFEYVTKVIGYKDSTAMAEAIRIGIPFEDIETGEIIEGTHTVQKNGLEYCVYYDRAEVTGTYDNETEYDVFTVEASVEGKPVTAVGNFAIVGLKSRKIILPDSITSVRTGAFCNVAAQEVVMSKGLKSIGAEAFDTCESLRLVYFPESITELEVIPDWAGKTELLDYFSAKALFAGKAGSVIQELAEKENLGFVPISEGVECVTDGVCVCASTGREAKLYGMLYKGYDGIKEEPSTYVIPDTINGVPITAIAGTAKWGKVNVYTVYLGSYVEIVEDGAFDGIRLETLITSPALQYLPYPLFRQAMLTSAAIYGYSNSYAEDYAKEHGYTFYPLDTVPFEDVSKDDWFYDAVYFCYMTELMNGTSLSTFHPDGTTTRAMLTKVLHNMSGAPTFSWEYGFWDVHRSDWYWESVNWCRYYGLAYGTSDRYFSPNQNVTREQVATFLCRYAEACGFPTDAKVSLSSYRDAYRVSSYAKSAMAWAVSYGIINGNTPTTLNPQGYATRAEIATMLMRFVQFAEDYVE